MRKQQTLRIKHMRSTNIIISIKNNMQDKARLSVLLFPYPLTFLSLQETRGVTVLSLRI